MLLRLISMDKESEPAIVPEIREEVLDDCSEPMEDILESFWFRLWRVLVGLIWARPRG